MSQPSCIDSTTLGSSQSEKPNGTLRNIGAITFVMPHFAGGSVHDALLEDYRFSISQAIDVVSGWT